MQKLIVVPFALVVACQSARGEPPPQSPPAAPVQATAPEKEYEIKVASPASVAPGAPADWTLTITPKAPWVLKTQTPFEVTLKPSTGLHTDKEKLGAKEFVDPKAPAKSVKTTVTAAKPGDYKLDAALDFFLCTEVICKRTKAEVTSTIIAK